MNNPFKGIMKKIVKPKGGVDPRISELRSETTGNPVDDFKHTFYHYRTIDTPKGIPTIETFRMLKRISNGNTLLSMEEINKIDIIHDCAIDEIKRKLQVGVSQAEQEAEKWVQEGVLTDQEVDMLLDQATNIAA